MKYKFNGYGSGTISEGYTSVRIKNDIAEINPNDADQVALAKKHGGEPIIVETTGKRSRKTEVIK